MYVITRHRPIKGECPEAPVQDDGQPYEWGMVYSGGAKVCWYSDITEATAALHGSSEYLVMTPQAQLVARIRLALRFQIARQAECNVAAMRSGIWDRARAEGPQRSP